MNARKFLVVVLLFGLLKICHAATPQPILSNSFELPQSQTSQVNVYPCLICPGSQGRANSNCLAQALQGGIGVQITF